MMLLSYKDGLKDLKRPRECIFISKVSIATKKLRILRSRVIKLFMKLPGCCVHCCSMLNILQLPRIQQKKQLKKALKLITRKTRQSVPSTACTFESFFFLSFCKILIFVSVQF